MAKFEKIRISLSRPEPGPLLEGIEHTESFRPRSEFLGAVFGSEHKFSHSRTGPQFDFLPLEVKGSYCGGIFRRRAPVSLHDESLESYVAKNYEGAVFIVSLAKDQTAWMQFNRRIGTPKSILLAFFNHLKARAGFNDWDVYISNYEDEREYFETIRTKRAEIAEISFTFVPPNALSADDAVYNFVKAVNNEAHPDLQKHTYRSAPGMMNPDTEHMNASARLAMGGGGEAEVRDQRRAIIYNGNKGKITREVNDNDLPTPKSPSFINRIRNLLFGDDADQ